jgi:hypothetical protein
MENYTRLLAAHQRNIVGIGVTAFNRVGLGLILPQYYIACLKNSADLKILKSKITNIFCVQQLENKDISLKYNSLSVLKSEKIIKKLNSLGKVSLFVYKSSQNIENQAGKLGFKILTNRAGIRDRLENKDRFTKILKQLNLNTIPDKKYKLSDFSWTKIVEFQKQFGPKVVLRLPEVTRGGGVGISFVKTRTDFLRFLKRKKQLAQTYDLKNVVIAKFIYGPSPSITGCATKYGTLAGVLQTQILDIPEVIDVKTGSGMFCGHDWSFKTYSFKIQAQAENIVKKFGAYIYKKGYKGIFGLDLLIDEQSNRVYACECNPRYTGAFPVFTMLQLKNKETPLDVFHLLEHMGADYQLNLPEVQTGLRKPKQGSHLLITNKANHLVENQGFLAAGVYTIKANKLQFLRPGFDLRELKYKNEFIWTDGCPFRKTIIKPHLRIGKLLFNRAILKDHFSLKKEIKEIVNLVYQNLDLKNIF